jgi:hypothetical protein
MPSPMRANSPLHSNFLILKPESGRLIAIAAAQADSSPRVPMRTRYRAKRWPFKKSNDKAYGRM